MSFVDKVGGRKGGSGSFIQQVGGKKPASEMGFGDKLLLEDAYLIFLCQDLDEKNRPKFAYVAVSYRFAQDFINVMEQKKWDKFSYYGVILLEGAGNPSDEQRKWMEETHGFVHKNYKPLEPARILVLYRTYDARDRLCYYYLAINEELYDRFIKITKSNQPIYPSQWGEVLAKGLGDPTQEVMMRMETEHGFDHRKALASS